MSAFIWFLTCMNHYMLVKSTILYKRFITLTALIWFLPSMNPHMSCKVNYLNKALITMAALVWILSRMSHYMLLKFISIYKGFLCYNSISRYLSLSIKFYKQYLSYRNPPRNGLAIPERQHHQFPILASQIWDIHADYHITSSINTWTTHQEALWKAGKGITHHGSI